MHSDVELACGLPFGEGRTVSRSVGGSQFQKFNEGLSLCLPNTYQVLIIRVPADFQLILIQIPIISAQFSNHSPPFTLESNVFAFTGIQISVKKKNLKLKKKYIFFELK